MVAAGYVAAFLLASAVVAVRVATTSGPDAQAASGMYAFGDALLFVAVFGVAGLIPTGAALYFVRPCRAFWSVASGLAVMAAATSLVAVGLFAAGRHAVEPSPLAASAALSVLRMLVAPLLALAFLVCAVLWNPRLGYLAASAMEGAATLYAIAIWFVPLLSYRF